VWVYSLQFFLEGYASARHYCLGSLPGQLLDTTLQEGSPGQTKIRVRAQMATLYSPQLLGQFSG
jgi:hypothetical protein